MITRTPSGSRSFSASLLAAALVAYAGSADAQTYQRPIIPQNEPAIEPTDRTGEDQLGVMTRDYTDFKPVGIGVSGFTLIPRLVTDVGFIDNVYARPTNTKSSAIATVAPEAVLRSQWSRHLLEVTGRVEAKRYASEKTENVENYRFSVGGGLNVTSDMQLLALIKRERQHDLRGDPDSANRTTEAAAIDVTIAELGLRHDFGRFNVRFDNTLRDYEYQSVTSGDGRRIDGNDRSFMTLTHYGRLSYEVNPDFVLFGEGAWQTRQHDRASGNGLKNRDSTGPEAGAGVNFALSAIWSGEIAVGYAERTIEDSSFGSVSAMTARAQLLWNMTRATSLRAQALRGIGETAVGPSVAYVSTTYWLGVEHQLQSDLLLGANISTRTLDYAKSRDETDVLSVGARATWFINRNFRAQAEYNFSRRDGTIPESNFDRNIGMLRLVSSF
ncbi:MAG: outer membrane beta-barrel protein [Elstera sp.]